MGTWFALRLSGSICVRLGNVFRRRWLPRWALTGVEMTIMASAGLSVFVVAVPLLAEAQSKDQVSLTPNAGYNAEWDACEAQARRRGTPPGTTGYVNFIEDCVRGSAHRAAAAQPRRQVSEKPRLGIRSANKSHRKSTSLARVIGGGS